MKKILGNKYEILREVGRGNMARVYLAMDMRMNKQWAVKAIDKNTNEFQATVDKQTTMTEINMLKSLDHYGLPRIVDMFDEPDYLYIVMDYIEGETLKVLTQKKPLSQERVVDIGIQLCDILSYLHNLNPPVIYRDLKPSNIMLTPEGKAKIIDFGIARNYDAEKAEDTVVFATGGYAPPEQLMGHTDTRSDIYSLGVTMFKLLTGDKIDKNFVIRDLQDINPDFSTGLNSIIRKCTNQDPDQRYQTAAEVKAALSSYTKLDEEYIEAVKGKKRTFKVMLIAGIICILLGGGIFYYGGVKETSDYNSLVSAQEVSIEKTEENCLAAIELKPDKVDAYTKLIKEYAVEGFSEKQASSFLSIYNENKEKIDKDKKPDLDFEIGETFLMYFKGKSDDSTRNVLLHAKPFFENAQNCTNAKRQKLAKNYVFLANYEESHIMATNNLNVKASDKEDIRDILNNLDSIVSLATTYDTNDAEYLKVVTYSAVLDILNSERESFIDENVSVEELSKIIDPIKEDLQDVSDKSADSLKKEIAEYKSDYESSAKRMGREEE